MEMKNKKMHTLSLFATMFMLLSLATSKLTYDGEVIERGFNKVTHCIDVYGEEECNVLINTVKMNCTEDRLHELCEKTCGYCAVPGIPLITCETSSYGCCSDKITPKSDPYGTNCPAVCQDGNPVLCPEYQQDCNEIGFVGEWMRKNCKKTCDVCELLSCKDEEDHAEFCDEWQKEGLCVFMEDMLRKSCPKTCGFCQ